MTKCKGNHISQLSEEGQSSLLPKVEQNINPTLDELFQDSSLMWGGGGGCKKVPPKICHTYPAMMRLGTLIP